MICLGIILLLLLTVLTAVCLKCFYQSKRQRGTVDTAEFNGDYAQYRELVTGMMRELEAVSCERVQCVAFDGLILSGRYYHLSDDAPIDIMAHGYRSFASFDFCGGFRLARRMGHNVLLIDQRACGESEGRLITFGIKERRDLMSWINYALCRFGDRAEINLFGVSMGAATVLMVNDLTLPENVRHIVADSPYNSPRDIIMKVAGDLGLPRWSWVFVRWAARLFCRMNIEESTAQSAVRSCRVPILIFHGEADTLVPCDMSRQLAAENENIHLVTIPGADHVAGLLVDRDKYRSAVFEFFGYRLTGVEPNRF